MTDPIAPSVTATDVELRVLIRGLKLSDDTRKLIDAAIRSAVLQELAAIDHNGTPQISSPANDPQTRSIFDNLARWNTPTMGLVATLGNGL